MTYTEDTEEYTFGDFIEFMAESWEKRRRLNRRRHLKKTRFAKMGVRI